MRNIGVRSSKKAPFWGPAAYKRSHRFPPFWGYEIRKMDKHRHKTMFHILI